jgi:hypothetical protein
MSEEVNVKNLGKAISKLQFVLDVHPFAHQDTEKELFEILNILKEVEKNICQKKN